MTIVRRKKSLKLEIKQISITFLFICVCVLATTKKLDSEFWKIGIARCKNQNLSEIIVYILAVIIFFPFFCLKLWDKKSVTFICYSMAEMALHMIILTDLEHEWINHDRMYLFPLYLISLLPLKLTRWFLGQSKITLISEVHVAHFVWHFWDQLYVLMFLKYLPTVWVCNW